MKQLLSKAYIVLAAFLMLAIAPAAVQAQSQDDEIAKTTIVKKGDKAPDFTVEMIDGSKIQLSKLKGKVVLINFWATWCPPCRAAMKTVDEIKPGLQEKGVVFVYITGETSPLEKWNEMIPGISGDHYRLTHQQWGELCRSLNIPGIPAYLILNKDGSEAYSNLSQGGYPGNDVILNNAEVALTK